MGGWGALLRFCPLPMATSVSVFQKAMVISPECLSYYGNEIVAEITALLSKLQLR